MTFAGVAIAFVAAAGCDVCWARYVAHASAGRRWSAAFWSVALYWYGAIAVVSYTTDHWLIIPALAGAFVGTAIGVRK